MLTEETLPRAARAVDLPKGANVFHAGDACEQFVVLVRGVIRVDLASRAGRAVTLYRFGAGETCVLTTACLFSGDVYSAEAVVEEDARLLALPRAAFEEEVTRSPEFRALVFSSFAERLAAMMEKVEDVAFTPVDARLSALLLSLAGDGVEIEATRDRLAEEIGAARETISRRLSAWERCGYVERRRGVVVVLDRDALAAMSIGA
ncbi:MAG: Crp/Fnr family transcriptional regulator [Pseudomonadota bacterium]